MIWRCKPKYSYRIEVHELTSDDKTTHCHYRTQSSLFPLYLSLLFSNRQLKTRIGPSLSESRVAAIEPIKEHSHASITPKEHTVSFRRSNEATTSSSRWPVLSTGTTWIFFNQTTFGTITTMRHPPKSSR